MVTTLTAPSTTTPETHRRFATTPSRLRLASLVLLALFAAYAILGTAALRARHSAAASVGLHSSPLLLDAQALDLALADADATASNAFLKAGLESTAQRQRYLDDLATATHKLASISEQAGVSSTAQDGVNVIAADLPIYAGLVEQARSNNRQGFPVGAAYLNRASSLMRSAMLPKATELYTDAARRLENDYVTGSSWPAAAGISVTLGLLVVGLLIAQIYVFRRSNRVVNVGLFAATILALIAGVWSLRAMQDEVNSLGRAQAQGSDIIQVLSSSRILLLHAQSDEDLALIARGGGGAFLDDLDYTLEHIGGADGTKALLGLAAQIVPRDDPPVSTTSIQNAYQEFVAAHDGVRGLDSKGSYPEAVALAIGDETGKASALDAILRDEIAYSNRRLDDGARAGRSGFDFLLVALPFATLVGAVLMLIGLQLRIREYR